MKTMNLAMSFVLALTFGVNAHAVEEQGVVNNNPHVQNVIIGKIKAEHRNDNRIIFRVCESDQKCVITGSPNGYTGKEINDRIEKLSQMKKNADLIAYVAFSTVLVSAIMLSNSSLPNKMVGAIKNPSAKVISGISLRILTLGIGGAGAFYVNNAVTQALYSNDQQLAKDVLEGYLPMVFAPDLLTVIKALNFVLAGI